MFLTPEQTGGPGIFALRRSNCYLAVWRPANGDGVFYEFDVTQLAGALGQDAGETWETHEAVILSACREGKLFEYLTPRKGK